MIRANPNNIMSDRDYKWALIAKRVLGWNKWDTGCDGCVNGWHGKRMDTITIKDCSDWLIVEQIAQAYAHHKDNANG